jgi:putative oxidoreductase
MNWFWRIADFAIGGIFIYAGVLKAMEPIRFAGDIENYHVIPWALGVRLAFYLPWLEILCGIAVIFRRLYAGGLITLLALTLVFIGATISAKLRGIDITCGCFGHASDNLGFTAHLVLNLVILIGLVLLMRRTAVSTEARL